MGEKLVHQNCLILREALRVLAHRPSGLLCDFDGTLSPIVSHPDQAEAHPLAIEAIGYLVDVLDVVGIISGRAAADVVKRLPVEGLVIYGNHGAEFWKDGTVTLVPAVARWKEVIADAARALRGELPFAFVEDKGVTISVHTRGIIESASRQRVTDVAHRIAAKHGLVARLGREVLELYPPEAVNKGSAVRALVHDFHLRGVIFAGDDVTDLDAFRTLRVLRQDGQLNALLLGVMSEEAPPELPSLVDQLVDGVERFARFLATLAAE